MLVKVNAKRSESTMELLVTVATVPSEPVKVPESVEAPLWGGFGAMEGADRAALGKESHWQNRSAGKSKEVSEAELNAALALL